MIRTIRDALLHHSDRGKPPDEATPDGNNSLYCFNFLTKRDRVQRETERYTNLAQMASASVKIISDTVAGWHEAGHPLRNHSLSSQFEVTPSPAEDNTGSMRVQDQQPPSSQGQIRARARGKEPLKYSPTSD